MTPVEVAADIWAVVITVCLLSVVLFFLSWAGASVLAIARARRRARRRPGLLTLLARGCAVSDLADIDDELEQILQREHWRRPAWVHADRDHGRVRLAGNAPSICTESGTGLHGADLRRFTEVSPAHCWTFVPDPVFAPGGQFRS